MLVAYFIYNIKDIWIIHNSYYGDVEVYNNDMILLLNCVMLATLTYLLIAWFDFYYALI